MRHRVPQDNRRCIDEIAFALGDLQVDAIIRIRLHVQVSIPGLDFRVGLDRIGMSRVIRHHTIRDPGPLNPLEIFKLVVNLYQRKRSVSSYFPRAARILL